MSSLKGWSDDHFTTDAEWVRWESNPTLHKATDLQSALTPCEISPVLSSDERLYGPNSMISALLSVVSNSFGVDAPETEKAASVSWAAFKKVDPLLLAAFGILLLDPKKARI